jgi:hypothetical protein
LRGLWRQQHEKDFFFDKKAEPALREAKNFYFPRRFHDAG